MSPSQKKSGFTLIEMLVYGALSAIVIMGAATILTDNSKIFFGTGQRLQNEKELVELEYEIKRVVRQALFVRFGGGGGEGWIRNYNSGTTSNMAAVGVFDREDGRKRISGVDSAIRATGLFFQPPTAAPDGTEYEGVFFIDHDYDGDGRVVPGYDKFFKSGLVSMRVLNPIELPVYGQSFNRLRSIDFEFRNRVFLPAAEPRDRCYRVTGCPNLEHAKESVRIFTVRLINNNYGIDPLGSVSLSNANSIYFFQEY